MRAEPRRVSRSASPATAAVVALRIALVAAAAGAAVAGLWIGRGGPSAQARRYACPMHGEVVAAVPGDCPICGMALEATDASGRIAPSAGPAAAPAGEPAGEATVEPALDPAAGRDHIALAALRASPESAALLRFSIAQARRNVYPGDVFAPAIVEPGGAITARLYRDELATLADHERAVFVPSAAPGDELAVVRAVTPPPVIHAALADVAFVVAPGAAPGAAPGVAPGAPAAAPPPGQVGWIRLAHRTRDVLVVRASSVIQSSDGPYVLVFSSQAGTLARRKVEVGKEFLGMTAIVGGLRDKEFVIMANAFSFDAERRLQAAP
jgi:hypothetical protein